MKSFKHHLSLIIPLFALLISFQMYLTVDRVVDSYEKSISNEYSIIVIANSKLEYEYMNKKIKNLKNIELVNPDMVLNKLKNKN